MKVFRLEHGSVTDSRTGLGCGPYAGSWELRDSVEDDDERREALNEAMEVLHQVTYSEDGASGRLNPICDPILLRIFPWEICGFNNLGDLYNWFGRALEALERNGFEVRQYEVPDCFARVGHDGQTLFEFAHARRVHNSEEPNV